MTARPPSTADVADASHDATERPLRVAILTTPAGLLTVHHLVKHLNVAGIVVDRGPWGSPSRAGNGSPVRRLKRVTRRCFDAVSPTFDPYRRARAAENAFLRKLDRLYFGYPNLQRDVRRREYVTWPELAEHYRVPIVEVENVNEERSREALRSWSADLGVIAGGRIVKPEVFRLPRLGTLNKHSSLLPRHRGLAAEYWCLYHGELDALGVTVHFVDEGCDTGPIVLQRPMPFERGDTPTTLRVKSEILGRELLVEAVRLIERTGTRGTPQDESRASRNGKPTPQSDRRLRRLLPRLWDRCDG